MENISKYILPTEGQITNEKQPTAVRPKPQVVYETVFASGSDFAVRRKTAKTSQILVCLFSQNQFYIKNENDGGKIQMLDSDILRKFTANIPEEGFEIEADGDKPCWIDTMEKNSAWAYAFMYCLQKPEITQYIQHGMFRFKTFFELKNVQGHLTWSLIAPFRHVQVVFDAIAAATNHDAAVQALTEAGMTWRYGYYAPADQNKATWIILSLFQQNSYNTQSQECAYDMIDRLWGVEGIRLFIRSCMLSPVSNMPNAGTLDRLFKRTNLMIDRYRKQENSGTTTEFNLKNFTEYMFYSCVEQGFARDSAHFWQQWADYLDAQYTLYGKVDVKYPAHLLSDEHVLQYRIGELRQKVNEEKWQQAVQTMLPYEWSYKGYKIICPKEQDDLVEEGRQMSHCVGNYASKVISGNSKIFFLRKADKINKSLVTIELDEHNNLNQCRARFNHAPAPQEESVVREWLNQHVRTLSA